MEPNVLLHTRSSEMSIRLAMEGLGTAFAPESYYHYLKDREPSSSVCLSIGKERIENTLIAAYQKNRYLPKYAKAYLNILAGYYQTKHG